MNSPEPAREFHHLTVHDPTWPRRRDSRLVQGYRPMDLRRRPPAFKTYPGLEVLPLPRDLPVGGRVYGLVGLSWLLFWSAGVVRVRDDGLRWWFRAAGSAGNLAPLELYVVTGGLPGLDPGVYHYQPLEHGLVRLRAAPEETPAALVVTGVPWRTAWKYTERGLRHLYWDAGTMLSQTLALAESAGLSPRIELGFVDRDISRLVGADGTHEFPLAVVPLGGLSALPEAGPEEVPVGHLAADAVEFPLITATQRAGDLHDDGAVAAWRRRAVAFNALPATIPAPWAPDEPIDEVIRRRGSTRRFLHGAIAPADLLIGGVGWASAPVPGDFVGPGRSLVETNLIVHAVEEVEPVAYRWDGGDGLVPLGTGDLRSLAAYLCLGQRLAADSCYTAFHLADVEQVTEVLGSRGYRAAQLEAGVIEGRLHLAAFSQGFGASGLTFFDEEVRRAFKTRAWPMLVTVVGLPAYSNKPAGSPRRPTPLSM